VTARAERPLHPAPSCAPSSTGLPEIPNPRGSIFLSSGRLTFRERPRRKILAPPRYYRCRGQRACRDTQVAAEDIEQRVLTWLRKPTGDSAPDAHFVLTHYAPIWEVLFPQVEQRLVAQLVWEVQWDGGKDKFTVVPRRDRHRAAAGQDQAERRRDCEPTQTPVQAEEGATTNPTGEVIRRRAFGLFATDARGTLGAVPGRKPAVSNYREDPLYPRIARTTDDLLRRGTFVAPVDVLLAMELLTRERLEDWRHGRVPFLERVINCNLTRLGRVLRILRFHAHDLNLKPSWTAYMRWGKGPKQRLRFTKTGDPKVEEAYATHFVWPSKVPFHERAAKEASP
jgi:hypothetical protein